MSGTAGREPAPLGEVDPFDLPAWLVTDEVTWVAEGGVLDGHLVPGRLSPPSEEGDGNGEEALPCDLLAADEAFPLPVAAPETRRLAHQAWRHGEVHLGERDGRLTLVVPGHAFDADRVLDAVARLSRAVGSDPGRYAVLLRIGGR